MNFHTLTFVAFFLAFYAVYRMPWSWTARKWQLLAAGYVFYGWFEPYYLALLLASTVANHRLACAIHDAGDPARRRRLLVLAVAGNLGVLGVFKYFNFFADNAVRALTALGLQPDFVTLHILLPIGISFFTFEAISYVVDIYRRTTKPADSLLDFALFLGFFPHLVSGPIIRARDFLPQLRAAPAIGAAEVQTGLTWIVVGYFFKIGVADNLASSVDYVFAGARSALPLELWLGVNYFAVQIFGDFFGYTLIARGLARLMGLDLVENFRFPYIAAGFSDFWRRWHISLSTWLRDYLYIPLGGSRYGAARTGANLMLTMLLGGLWHGAAWTFVLWGGLHGAYLVLERCAVACAKRLGAAGRVLLGAGLALHLAKIAVTYVLVLIAWVFFRADGIGQAAVMLGGMFDLARLAQLDMPNKAVLKDGVWMLPALLYFAWGLYVERGGAVPRLAPSLRMALLGALAFITITCREASDAFIYFQF